MQITINDEGVKVNGKDWKELSAGKKITYAVLFPFLILFCLVVAVLAICIALGAVAIVVPVVMVIVVIALVLCFVGVAIWLPIAIFRRGK